jgi:hypothetical protein
MVIQVKLVKRVELTGRTGDRNVRVRAYASSLGFANERERLNSGK